MIETRLEETAGAIEDWVVEYSLKQSENKGASAVNYRDLIIEYFDCFRVRNLERLRQLLSDKTRHISPFGEWKDRDAMLDAIWPSVTGQVYASEIQIFGTGPEFLVRYRHSGQSSGHIAESFRFEDDRIAEIEVYLGIHAIPDQPPSHRTEP